MLCLTNSLSATLYQLPHASMKPHRLLLAGTALSVIGGAYGYHHWSTAKNNAVSTASVHHDAIIVPTAALKVGSPSQSKTEPQPIATSSDQTAAASTERPTHAKQRMSKTTLTEFLDKVIADAIQRGSLDPNRLAARQLALLPEKFRKKHDDSPQLSAEEIAHVEQQLALGDDAPPDPPPQLPCPDPDHLPDNYNNDYNKMILRQRGCQL